MKLQPSVKNASLAFIITALIFGTGFWTANAVNTLRLNDIRDIESRIAIDTLSLETQFDLLSRLSCTDISENSVLSTELNTLSSQLDYTESQLGAKNDQVIQLKRQYSLLEIKDYLLMQQVSEKCGLKPVFVLYFYSNQGDCPACDSAGNVLTYLRETYPKLRVYSFDYNLNLGALDTLISINKIQRAPPAFVVNGKAYYGLSDLKSIQKILPLSLLATSTPSTAKKTSTKASSF